MSGEGKARGARRAALNLALAGAVKAGDARELRRLLEAGANPQSAACLSLAAGRNDLACVEALLEAGCKPNGIEGRLGAKTALVSTSSARVAEALIRAGAHPDGWGDGARRFDERGFALQWSSLMLAQNGEKARALLEAGADPTLRLARDGISTLGLLQRSVRQFGGQSFGERVHEARDEVAAELIRRGDAAGIERVRKARGREFGAKVELALAELEAKAIGEGLGGARGAGPEGAGGAAARPRARI